MAVQCSRCQTEKTNFHKKCNSEVPVTAFSTNETLFKSTLDYTEYGSEESSLIYEKITYNSLDTKCLKYDLLPTGRPVFWGMDINTTSLNLLKRKFTPEPKIPRILHQCWVSDKELTPLKKKVVEATRKVYKDWEYKMWTKEDITR